MMLFPTVMAVPLMAAIGSEATWPTLGAVLAWTLVAALIGSGIGLLRGGVHGASAPTRRKPIGFDSGSSFADFDRADTHREAA